MMKEEFERLVGRTVTAEQYKHIEELYMDSTMNKYDFAKAIKPLLKGFPVRSNKPRLIMAVHNAYGEMLTPNHACYMTVLVELIDVNIKTGKKTVKVLPDSFEFRYSCDLTDWDPRLEIIHSEEIYK